VAKCLLRIYFCADVNSDDGAYSWPLMTFRDSGSNRLVRAKLSSGRFKQQHNTILKTGTFQTRQIVLWTPARHADLNLVNNIKTVDA
jgi:hypothetical protein